MKIKLLDVKKLEKDITAELNKQGHTGKFHLRSDKYGVVENHKTIAVVDKELVGQVFNSANKEARFCFDIYKDAGKDAIAIFPCFNVKYDIEGIKDYQTKKQETVEKFMAERYQYNGRLQSNQAELERVFSV